MRAVGTDGGSINPEKMRTFSVNSGNHRKSCFKAELVMDSRVAQDVSTPKVSLSYFKSSFAHAPGKA